VESWSLTHSFPNPGDGTRAGLWLERISHAGLVGTTTAVPDVTFGGVQMNNRVDSNEGLLAMNWWRIQTIANESGGQIAVEYSPRDCAPGDLPTVVSDNRRRCYPVRWTPEGYTSQITDYFHKYVVKSVSEEDLTHVSARTITSYVYPGSPAWHYTDDDGLIKADNKTWSVWRGYDTVQETKGDPGQQTQTRTRYFRGMNGDRQPSGARTVILPAVGAAPVVNDEDAYAGMVRETIAYNGPGGAEVSGQVSEPWRSQPTAARTVNGSTVEARFVNTAATWSRVARDGGRPDQVTSSRSTFDDFGMVTKVEDSGDTSLTGDERCTLTDYARNTNSWLIAFPSRVRSYAVDCTRAAGGGLTEADLLGDSRTSYDQQSFGAAPTRGLASKLEVLKDWNPATQVPTYLTTSTSSHDSYGRITGATDVRGNTITTVYTHNAGGQLASTRVTNQLGWVTTATQEPAWGTVLTTIDPNGRETDLAYDGLGRLTAVWLPGRDKNSGQTASKIFTYSVRNDVRDDVPVVITTAKLAPNNNYVTAYSLFDGFLRPRQTQAPEAGTLGGRVVSEAFYDSAGRTTKTVGPYLAEGAPGATLYLPGTPNTPPDESQARVTTTVFDGAGRPTASIFSSNLLEWRTSTSYGGDRIDVTPPGGGTATSTHFDARGRKVKLWQYHGSTPTPTLAGSYDQTTYTYDNKDQVTKITDPASNHWDYTYDLLGRRTQADDPDAGRTKSTYSDAGDLLTATDARGKTLAFTYDSLGRKTSVRDGGATGPKRTEFVYDTLADGTTVRGRLVESIRYADPNGDGTPDPYSAKVVGFNTDYTPTGTTITIPSAEEGLAGSYTYSHTYRVDGSPYGTVLPDIDGVGSGLAAETLTRTYTSLGAPYELKTNYGGTSSFYVYSTTYTRYGETAVTTYRNNGGKMALVGRYYEVGTRRLSRMRTTRETAPSTVADQYFTYDASGNITQISDASAGDQQCLTYDHLRRLTEAWAPAGADCLTAPSLAGLGGPARYWSTWSFDAVGNRLTQEAYNAATGMRDTTTYNHPTAGGSQPHTLTSTAGATSGGYTYDPAGNTLTRPTASAGTQTLTWDPEGHLAAATDSSGTTSYLYDANGQRLIRRDATGKTLYLPGQELRYTTSSGAKTTIRYYTHSDRVVASRTTAGLTWLVGDHQGTAQVSIAASTQAASTRRQTPYGTPRGTIPTWPNDKGFVGGTNDNTGLTHLGAREYDPAIGRFASPDPILDFNDPQQINGYAYANNSPTTDSDPTGLWNDHDSKDTVPPVPNSNGYTGVPSTNGSGSHSNASDDTRREANRPGVRQTTNGPRCNADGDCAINSKSPLRPTMPTGKPSIICFGAGHTCGPDSPPLQVVDMTVYRSGVQLWKLANGRIVVVVPGAAPYVLPEGFPDPEILGQQLDYWFSHGTKNPGADENPYANWPAAHWVEMACVHPGAMNCGVDVTRQLDRDVWNNMGGFGTVTDLAGLISAAGSPKTLVKELMARWVGPLGKDFMATNSESINEAILDLAWDMITETGDDPCGNEFTCDR